jgi:hypothetical protein
MLAVGDIGPVPRLCRLEVEPAVSKPLSSSGGSSANRASAQQLQTLDRAGWESVNHFSANPNDGTGLP